MGRRNLLWNGAERYGGRRSAFVFWAPGEPNNQNGNENCGEIQGIQGWNDSRCDFEAKPFVCEQWFGDPRPRCGDGKVQAGEACVTAVKPRQPATPTVRPWSAVMVS